MLRQGAGGLFSVFRRGVPCLRGMLFSGLLLLLHLPAQKQ